MPKNGDEPPEQFVDEPAIVPIDARRRNEPAPVDHRLLYSEGLDMIRSIRTTLALMLASSSLLVAEGTSDWPQWRGPKRDGVSNEVGLRADWKANPPAIVWQTAGMGRGFAAPAVVGEMIYITGADAGKEFVLALAKDASTDPAVPPKTLWKTDVSAAGDVGYPGSRCTPTIDGQHLFATTTTGMVACLDRTSGNILWQVDMAKSFGGKMMSVWGFSESPLVDGDLVIVTPGSDEAAIVALNKKDGKEVWRSAIPGAKGAGYASLVISEGAGIKQYVTLLGRGLVSVAAKDGKLLWTYDKVANGTANIPTPIVRGDYVFASTGYQTGSVLVQLTKKGNSGVDAKEVYFLPHKVLQNHHGGMVLIGDYLYGGHGHNEGAPICVNFVTGKVAWRERRGPGDGSAAVSYADGHLYFRYQNGKVALIEASPEEYREKGTFTIPDVQDPSWPHPVIAGGKLLLREQDRLYAYDCSAAK
jgi:outer membrane protein assembly factor BamB